MKRQILALAAAPCALLANVADAAPVSDCPLRDAPFSASSPLVDLLSSPAAIAILEDVPPTRLGKASDGFADRLPPGFPAIVSFTEVAGIAGIDPAKINSVDAKLRLLPVTDADRTARCARYDNDVPVFRLGAGRPRLLLFEKINGFRDGPSVNAAHSAFQAMARRKGWVIAATDKGGAFNRKTLAQFDAVIWNNVSGDVLTRAQRSAFRNFIRQGGGYVGIHGSAGDPVYFWDWYPDKLIGARWLGHPDEPQFQEARVTVNKAHPLARNLPREWRMTDEWYSFRTNPRKAGVQVVLSLDESTYAPVGIAGMDLRMGDHPLAWTHCIGKGRVFYSAIGHRPETYSQHWNVAMLEAAVNWAASRQKACSR